MTVLLDSNILIDHLRQVEAARDLIRRLGAEGTVRASVLSRAEIRSGHGGASVEVDDLLAHFTWELPTVDIADRAGAFVRRYGPGYPNVGLVDYIVAATADVLGLRLVTRNVRHFPMFPDLQPPY